MQTSKMSLVEYRWKLIQSPVTAMTDVRDILLWFVDIKSGDYIKKTKFVLHLQWPRRGTEEADIVTSDKLRIPVLPPLLMAPHFLTASQGHTIDV